MPRTFCALSVALVTTLACTTGRSTSLTDTWRAPQPTSWPLYRMLTSFVSTDPAMRRAVEDRMAARIPGAFAAYRAVPELALGNTVLAQEQLRGKLFDGAIVIRLLPPSSDSAQPAAPDWQATAPSFYRNWEPWWNSVRDPSYVVAQREVVVEVLIYSLEEDRLLWAARATTPNPRSVQALLDNSVDAVVRELWSQRTFQVPWRTVGMRPGP